MAEIAVVGPGAVGATFAAAAERAGHDVLLCGRRAGPAPVVELPDGSEHALAGPIQADPEARRRGLDPARGQDAPDCRRRRVARRAGRSRQRRRALQNGVEHRALVAPLAGQATVLPAIVWCPSEGVAPGRVRQRGPARISVPDEPAGAAWPPAR